ncbi:double zinc ribbon domain-containing protein [Nitrosomonas sp. Is37]|uniref:double zinc ribbon domain-containing protein n=1 Tax=Nitrosomonas sp. Is37 TaxID=3080535 RepID=UPI00294B73AF|nr:double zinc ribbon domain-containing protein [Nitrosomonas sp. Is37]MDV6344455.1 double zinc ribbon domain-containing protein [Nitrosomonas sp. Is37]
MQTLFPANCLLCLAACESDLCHACYNNLPQLPSEHCPLCLLPTKDSRVCGNCLKNHPVWTRTIAALQYAFPVDAMIRSLKYQENLTLAPILANLLIAKTNNCPPPDVIIPVPLHPIRLQERGFNQALEISRHISRQMNIPLLPHACVRTKDTLSQTELSWKKRQTNMRNAFECTTNLAHKHVALLDDVMTSGATLNELAKVVRKQGAIEVSVWVITRAIPSTALIKTTEHQTIL